jgi:hypothetical protein
MTHTPAYTLPAQNICWLYACVYAYNTLRKIGLASSPLLVSALLPMIQHMLRCTFSLMHLTYPVTTQHLTTFLPSNCTQAKDQCVRFPVPVPVESRERCWQHASTAYSRAAQGKTSQAPLPTYSALVNFTACVEFLFEHTYSTVYRRTCRADVRPTDAETKR